MLNVINRPHIYIKNQVNICLLNIIIRSPIYIYKLGFLWQFKKNYWSQINFTLTNKLLWSLKILISCNNFHKRALLPRRDDKVRRELLRSDFMIAKSVISLYQRVNVMPLNILKYILAGRFTMVLISTDRNDLP